MVLRKLTFDNSVRYIPKSERAKEIKQNTTKKKKQKEKIQPFSGGGKPNTRKQNKIISQNSKKIPQKCCSKWIWIYYKIVFIQS